MKLEQTYIENNELSKDNSKIKQEMEEMAVKL
jgi:hypothetical protein